MPPLQFGLVIALVLVLVSYSASQQNVADVGKSLG